MTSQGISDFMDSFRFVILDRYPRDSCKECGKIIWTGNRKRFNSFAKHKCDKRDKPSRTTNIFRMWISQFISKDTMEVAIFFQNAYLVLSRNSVPEIEDFNRYIDFVQILRYTLSEGYASEWVTSLFEMSTHSIIMGRDEIIELFDEFDYCKSKFDIEKHANCGDKISIDEFLSILLDEDFGNLEIDENEEIEENEEKIFVQYY
jgi:hypothetical protein